MNTNLVVSLNAATGADLAGKEGVRVKLVATGIDIAGAGDRAIGTLVRGPLKDTVNGACAVFLFSNGLHYGVIANATAIDPGDLLEAAAAGKVRKLAARAITGVHATDVITATAHGLADGTAVRLTALTGGTGLTLGVVYFVRDAADDTFKLATWPGGAAVDFSADITAGSVTPANPVAIAMETAPASSADGQIRVLPL
jgi:hypothetical protein